MTRRSERYGWYFLTLCLLMVAWMAGAVAAPETTQTVKGAAYREMVQHIEEGRDGM